jgi:hypothetical protein
MKHIIRKTELENIYLSEKYTYFMTDVWQKEIICDVIENFEFALRSSENL